MLRISNIEDTHVCDVAKLLEAHGPSLDKFEMSTWALHTPAWEGQPPLVHGGCYQLTADGTDALSPHGALLRHNTRLRTLSLLSLSLSVSPGAYPLLPQLPLVLAQVSGDSLSELSLELFLERGSSVLTDLAAVGWDDVRAVLARPPFEGLRTLRVGFKYHRRGNNVTPAQVERRMRELLPEAQKRGILVVEHTRNHSQ